MRNNKVLLSHSLNASEIEMGMKIIFFYGKWKSEIIYIFLIFQRHFTTPFLESVINCWCLCFRVYQNNNKENERVENHFYNFIRIFFMLNPFTLRSCHKNFASRLKQWGVRKVFAPFFGQNSNWSRIFLGTITFSTRVVNQKEKIILRMKISKEGRTFYDLL